MSCSVPIAHVGMYTTKVTATLQPTSQIDFETAVGDYFDLDGLIPNKNCSSKLVGAKMTVDKPITLGKGYTLYLYNNHSAETAEGLVPDYSTVLGSYQTFVKFDRIEIDSNVAIFSADLELNKDLKTIMGDGTSSNIKGLLIDNEGHNYTNETITIQLITAYN